MFAFVKPVKFESDTIAPVCVVVPETTKLPLTVKSFDTVTSAGNPYVIVPELSDTSTSFDVPANVIVPPNAVAVELPDVATVILEFARLLFEIEPANILFSTEPAAIVNAVEVLPRLVIVAEPVTSPVKLSTGSATLKSKVPSESSYVTVIPLSVLVVTIPPTTSSTDSVKSEIVDAVVFITKSIVPSPSSYDAVIPVSVFELNIAPIVS